MNSLMCAFTALISIYMIYTSVNFLRKGQKFTFPWWVCVGLLVVSIANFAIMVLNLLAPAPLLDTLQQVFLVAEILLILVMQFSSRR